MSLPTDSAVDAAALDRPPFSKATTDAACADAVRALFSKHGMQAVPWARRIIAAATHGIFSDEDRGDSGNWNRCALGTATAPIEFVAVGGAISTLRPADKTLWELAKEFDAAVWSDDFPRAAAAVIKIEKRAAQLAADG